MTSGIKRIHAGLVVMTIPFPSDFAKDDTFEGNKAKQTYHKAVFNKILNQMFVKQILDAEGIGEYMTFEVKIGRTGNDSLNAFVSQFNETKPEMYIKGYIS